MKHNKKDAPYTLERLPDWLDCKHFSILVDGQVVGEVRQCFPSFERKHPSARYVLARWRTKRARWIGAPKGEQMNHRLWTETRREIIERVIGEASA